MKKKLDYSNENIYILEIENISDINFNDIDFTGFEWSIFENKLKVELKSKSLNELLQLLLNNNIKIMDINRYKKGSEEKYIEMFPDEMEKIREYM